MSEQERIIVTPGEVLANGENYLPGNGTRKQGEEIVSTRFGLSDEEEGLIRVIPLSGGYQPRRGNLIIGKVEQVTFNGWLVNVGNSENAALAFLSLNEVPKFLNQGELKSFMGVGDMVVAKVSSKIEKNLTLTIKGKGLGKVREGIVFKINPYKVPRVIGKEGSMIKLIKERTGCNVMMGQNGYILAKGESIDNELLAREAVNFIVRKATIEGLTDAVEKFFEDKGVEKPVKEESSSEEELNEGSEEDSEKENE